MSKKNCLDFILSCCSQLELALNILTSHTALFLLTIIHHICALLKYFTLDWKKAGTEQMKRWRAGWQMN